MDIEQKNTLIKTKFKEAIDAFSGKEHYFTSQFGICFKVNGRRWEIEVDGHIFKKYTATISGTAAFSESEMQISQQTYLEIVEYFDEKILSLNLLVK